MNASFFRHSPSSLVTLPFSISKLIPLSPSLSVLFDTYSSDHALKDAKCFASQKEVHFLLPCLLYVAYTILPCLFSRLSLQIPLVALSLSSHINPCFHPSLWWNSSINQPASEGRLHSAPYCSEGNHILPSLASYSDNIRVTQAAPNAV